MSGLQGEESIARAQEIAARYTSPKEKELIKRYMQGEGRRIESDIDAINERLERMLSVRQQVKELGQIVSLKYIAEHYFGKSSAWLSQRINGSPIRGKVYFLKESEIDTLNFAIQDISKKLGSLSIV